MPFTDSRPAAAPPGRAPIDRPPRRWPVRLAVTGLALVTAFALWAGLSIVGLAPAFPWSRTVATWQLPDGASPDPESTSLTILVTRIECNGGETGTVRTPRLAEATDRIVITAYVAPSRKRAANCLGNNPVPVQVRLSQPLGTRTLVDGACAGPAADLAMCADAGGVRWPRPAN